MRWTTGVPISILTIVALGCGSSHVTQPSTGAAGRTAASQWWGAVGRSNSAASGHLKSTANIDGFRVHPDPGDDGVIHVFAGESVAVNATDIASRPPAPQSYLVVNWGDGPNQRVGCGPCRADHSYAPGRYTLVASADNLQPAAGGATDRSITLAVEVSPRREKPGLKGIQPFALSSTDIAVGETTYLLVPIFLPDDVVLTYLDFVCSPDFAAFPDFGNEIFDPPNVALPFVGLAPGVCTFAVAGTLNGDPFAQSATFTVH